MGFQERDRVLGQGVFGSIGSVGLRASAVGFGESRAALDGDDFAFGWV